MKPQMTLDSGPMAEELALLGHDIRSAITDIMAGLSLIDTQGLDANGRIQLDRTKATAEALVRYLETGLTTLMVQSPPKPEANQIDLAKLLQDLERRWGYREGGFVITATDLPAVVKCDRIAIDRILSNLIGNAIAYSNGHAVNLTVTLPEPQTLRFTITDQGPGFPKALDKASITGSALPAWQNSDGHGLGLGIAKTLAQRIGASLTLQNDPAGGGIATISLPLRGMAMTQPQPETPVNCLHGKHILVADDSMPQLMLLSQFLSESGAQVTMARDGDAALAALQAGTYDLALLDHEMPGQTGLALCKALRDRQTPQAKALRIVILTAHPLAKIQQAAIAAGADHVISKPVTSARTLTDALCHMGTHPPPKRKGTAPPNTNSDAFEKLLDMAGPELAPELLARFHEDLVSVQNRLTAGVESLDWKGLRAASHVLISLAGTAGFKQLEQASRDFNAAAHDTDENALLASQDTVLNGLVDLIDHAKRIAQARNY